MSKRFRGSHSVTHLGGDKKRPEPRTILIPKVLLNVVFYKMTTYAFSSGVLKPWPKMWLAMSKWLKAKGCWLTSHLSPSLSLSTRYVPDTMSNGLHQSASRWGSERVRSLPTVKQVRGVIVGFEPGPSVWLQISMQMKHIGKVTLCLVCLCYRCNPVEPGRGMAQPEAAPVTCELRAWVRMEVHIPYDEVCK